MKYRIDIKKMKFKHYIFKYRVVIKTNELIFDKKINKKKSYRFFRGSK